VFCCMNWYFLWIGELWGGGGGYVCAEGVRDHLFEAVDCAFDLGTVGDIVFDAVDDCVVSVYVACRGFAAYMALVVCHVDLWEHLCSWLSLMSPCCV
jgi:hypothetical protein